MPPLSFAHSSPFLANIDHFLEKQNLVKLLYFYLVKSGVFAEDNKHTLALAGQGMVATTNWHATTREQIHKSRNFSFAYVIAEQIKLHSRIKLGHRE